MTSHTRRVSAKGQITLPGSVRTTTGLTPGTEVIILPRGSRVEVIRAADLDGLFEPFDILRKQGRLTRRELARLVAEEKKRTWARFRARAR